MARALSAVPDPYASRLLADVPRFHARERGERAALVFGSRTTSWAELDARSSQVARALLAEGLGPLARVAVLDKDSERSYELAFGCAKAGAVLMSVNWRLAPAEIAYILDHGQAEIAFVGAEFAAKFASIAGGLARVKKVVALGGEHARWPGYVAWRDARAPDDPRLVQSPEDVAVQMYTSGTTGHPKGVMLASRSLFAVIASMREHRDPWIGWSAEDTSLLTLPTFHIGGLWWAVTGLAHGARNVVMDAFSAGKALDLLARERVTKVCLVPAMMQMLLAEPACRTTDFSALGWIVYGGSPIPAALLEQAAATFGCRFAQIYGLTETGNTAVCLRHEEHQAGLSGARPELLRAAGRPYPGVALKVIDREGRELPPRAVGEVCIRSPANMLGYWRNPEATARTLVDGWLHSGDAGYLDEEGRVYVCDRVKDMIIYAGENVYPAEVESALASHPAVAEVAVIGVPHERWGESIKAVVALKPGAHALAREILAHAVGRIADFKLPTSVDFVASLPRTPSGKVKKAELREPYWRGRERQVN